MTEQGVSGDPFSPENLRIDLETATKAKVAAKAGPKRTKTRTAEEFGQIPLRLVPQLAKSLSGVHWGVVVCLAYQMVLTHGKPVPATKGRTGCSNGRARREAIRRLEALNLASVQWGSKGIAPLVSLKF